MVPRELNMTILKGGKSAIEVSYDVMTDRMSAKYSIPNVQWIIGECGNWETLEWFLQSRVMTKREDFQTDLKMLGLEKWDEWSILEKTKGKMWGDDITLDIRFGAADINV